MIFVTGDTHNSHDIEKIKRFAEANPHLTKDDYLIVCGDFGLLWNWTDTGISIDTNPKDTCWTCSVEENVIKGGEIWLAKWYDGLPFTTLFVDGNHENHRRLNSYPISEWHGGKVHKITNSIIHLMRGQVFQLCGKTLFTFGGAYSIDRGPATGTQEYDEGVCWWPEEICSQDERNEAVGNLLKHENKVDIMLTHCLSDKQAMRMGYSDFNATTNFLSNVEDMVDFEKWFCGHYHIDEWISTKIRCLYQDIVKAI